MVNKKKNKRKNSKKYKSKQHKTSVPPYTPVKMKLFKLDDPFQNIPIEERENFIRQIYIEAENKFQEIYPKIKEWFVKHDATYLLSFCAFYFLAHPAGQDPEVIKGRMEFYHHYLELLQAFALTQPRSFSPNPLLDKAEELESAMKEIGRLFSFRQFKFPENASQEEIIKLKVIADMRTKTFAVRNWAYTDQIKKHTLNLFSQVSTIIEQHFGVEPEKIVHSLEMISKEVNDKLNVHLEKGRAFLGEQSFSEVCKVYSTVFLNKEPDPSDSDKMYKLVRGNIKQLKSMLVTHSDLFLSEIFTFTLDEITHCYGNSIFKDKIKTILDLWSYSFGDLNDNNIEHFILDNPILKRPFIKLEDEVYFCPTIGIFYHFLPTLLEQLILKIGKEAKGIYDQIRGKYLEDETAKLFQVNFPSASIFKGSKWLDVESGKTYENDLIVIIDNFAIVVECKAGFVDPPARRGAELRLISTLEDLVVKPAIQANQFVQFLSKNKGIYNFQTHRGVINTIVTTSINYFIPLTVTYEQLGNISGNLKKSIQGGLIPDPPDPLVPSMCLTDLEIVFHLLESEVEKVHYFVRRAQIEKSLHYEADELDLLAFYLDTGFNLGEYEFKKDVVMNLQPKSKELDPYFVGRIDGVQVTKPTLSLTKWWKDIIKSVVTTKIPHWIEIGFILLNVLKNEQINIEKNFRNLQKKLQNGKINKLHVGVSLFTTPKQRSYLIAIFPHTITDQQTMMAAILSQQLEEGRNILGGVCIGVSNEGTEYPYQSLAYIPKEDMYKAFANK